MALSDFPVRAQIAVSDIDRAVAFYEGTLGLPVVRSGPSATIAQGSRIYASGGGPALIIYQSAAVGSRATLATWFVDDIRRTVHELTARGVDFERYDGVDHDASGVTDRAGGGYIAWFCDPDGNTFAIESDA